MNKLSREEIKQHVESVGIEKSKLNPSPGTHAIEYNKKGEIFYIKDRQKAPFVLHPEWRTRLQSNPIDGVWPKDVPDRKYYLNADLTKFPKLNPASDSNCGCDVDIRDLAALDALLVRIGALQAPEPDETTAFADIEAAAPQLATLSKTEREAVIAAWIGQGRFRIALMSAWSNRCAVTGIDVGDLLRASHIKPWRDSDNGDRLDAENGFLLVATLDAAFDAGLISFADDGLMLFSARLGPDPCAVLSVPAGCRLTRGPSSRQQAFLRHHRDHVFPHGPPHGKGQERDAPPCPSAARLRFLVECQSRSAAPTLKQGGSRAESWPCLSFRSLHKAAGMSPHRHG